MKKHYFILFLCFLSLNFAYAQPTFVDFSFNPNQPCTGTPTQFQTDTIGFTSGFGTYYNWRIDNIFVHGGFGGFGATFSTTLSFGWHDVELQITDSIQGITLDTTKTVFVDSICNLNSISGEVYFDANSNGVKDPGELNINNASINMYDGTTNFFLNSGTNGVYNLFVSPGTYDVSINVPSYYNITEPSVSNSYQITLSGTGMTSQFNDFGITTDSIVKDLSISLTNTPLRPGFNGQIKATVRNNGTFPDSSNVVIFLDPLTPLVSSVPGADSVNGNIAYFTLSNMLPNAIRRIRITTKIDSTVQIGTPFNLSSFAFPVTGDANPIDNFDTLSGVIVGSYDPNDKLVFPNDDSTNSFERGTPMTYTIRFQNTGTFFAENVRLVDEIETNLDLNSFEMIAASHSYTYQVNNNNRKIVWRFDDIMLPAEQDNEPESHGYVKFRIDVDSSLSLGDTVYNSAEIYFDFNLPIITNTIVSTLDSFVTTTSIEKQINHDSDLIGLYPNPFENEVNFKVYDEGYFDFKLFTIEGDEVLSKRLNGNQPLNLEMLNSGLYLYKIRKDSGEIQRGKLIRK